jgi:hypothetical protein
LDGGVWSFIHSKHPSKWSEGKLYQLQSEVKTSSTISRSMGPGFSRNWDRMNMYAHFRVLSVPKYSLSLLYKYFNHTYPHKKSP